MITLDELVKEAGRVDDLDHADLERAFRAVSSATGPLSDITTAAEPGSTPRRQVAVRVGFVLAATFAVAVGGIGVANLTGAFSPNRDVVAGQDGSATPQDGPEEATGEDATDPLVNGAFAGVSPGSYEDNGDVVWRIYADAATPDVTAQTVASRFTSAELDTVFIQLEEFASDWLSGGKGSADFFSHAYDAETDTVRVITNIPEQELPADLVASGVLTYQFSAVAPELPIGDEPSDGELPSEDD